MIDRSDLDNLTSDFVILFRLMNRSIEYLQYSQNYLKSFEIAMDWKYKDKEYGNDQDKTINE